MSPLNNAQLDEATRQDLVVGSLVWDTALHSAHEVAGLPLQQ